MKLKRRLRGEVRTNRNLSARWRFHVIDVVTFSASDLPISTGRVLLEVLTSSRQQNLSKFPDQSNGQASRSRQPAIRKRAYGGNFRMRSATSQLGVPFSPDAHWPECRRGAAPGLQGARLVIWVPRIYIRANSPDRFISSDNTYKIAVPVR